MSTTPSRSDTTDNRRARIWIIVAVVIVLIGALLYFYRGTQADGQPGVVAPLTPPASAPSDNTGAPAPSTGAPVSPNPSTSGPAQPANPGGTPVLPAPREAPAK